MTEEAKIKSSQKDQEYEIKLNDYLQVKLSSLRDLVEHLSADMIESNEAVDKTHKCSEYSSIW